jgi:cbb3-type cytochrome oxidase cytochrome c subunit
MHLLFWLASCGFLAATIWLLVRDADRPWKAYQREYRERFSPRAEPGIRQIVLPELTQDLHFRQIGRCDRCVTCHMGIERKPKNDEQVPLTPGPDHIVAAIGKGGDTAQPFATHPRLDLFVGASSPHPMGDFGCTVCHEGQGNATDFRWASHAPNDAESEKRWREKLGWSPNPDWDFPMLPKRFAESRCLLCHRDATDLEPSERFPDPPAAKLMAGYHLVRRLGCYGCHELEDAAKRQAWAGDTARKLGTNLRPIAEKISLEHLADRIADPSHFLPDSRMPKLFGMTDHLDGAKAEETRRFEALEIRAIAAYLMQASETTKFADLSTSDKFPSSVERGKKLFETQGCLACHMHGDFPRGSGIQGPDLSRVGAKYTAPRARPWLIAWLRDPTVYSPQTTMPNPRLAKELPLADGKNSDPVEDIAEYLLASKGEFRNSPLPEFSENNLDAFGSFKGNLDDKLQQLGKIAIAKRGCFGCHDIAGFEQTQRIGPALSNWGRKPTAQLAFEKITEYSGQEYFTASGERENQKALLEHRREGFVWQKLRAPRSFDYRVAQKRKFGEFLRMGRFNLTDDEREAIMTFVLGLTTDAMPEKYASQPDPRRAAIVEGRKTLDRFACAECHLLDHERWTFSYKPGALPAPTHEATFDFLRPHFSEQEIAASRKTDADGLARVEIAGIPRLDSDGRLLEEEEDDGRMLAYFTLHRPAVIDGKIWMVGGSDVPVLIASIAKKRPAWGGTFARLLYPTALADAMRTRSNPVDQEAWGWLPPALAEEGARAEASWLKTYLLEPTSIRPAAILPMPKFHLSDEEANSLVSFFSATSRNPNPSLPGPKTQDLSPKTEESVLRLLLDSKDFCAKCHVIGDYRPASEGNAIVAPDLTEAGRRLQRSYLRRWLADPKSILPYTPMPQIFPAIGEPRGQEILPGESLRQIDVIEQFLRNYDAYAKRRMPIKNRMNREDK